MMRQIETAFAIFALIFLTGATVTILTPASALLAYGSSGSPMVRLLALAVGLSGGGVFVLHKNAINHLISRYWPILIPPAFAVLSIFWAADLSLALRRCAALVMVTLLGVWLAERYSKRALFNIVLAAGLILCFLSLAAIVAKPGLGTHTASNGANLEHIGAWRGLLAHKNDFGRLAALVGVMCVIAAFTRSRLRLGYLVGALLALGLVLGSRSGQAVVLFALPPIAVAGMMWLRTLTPQFRALAIVLVVPFSAVVAVGSGFVVTAVLEALGKDATLTGRTDIWYAVWQALTGHFLLGGGYGSGWQVVSVEVQKIMGWSRGLLSHAHNGYLDLMTDIGAIGVGLTIALYLWTLGKTFRAIVAGKDIEFAAFGFAVVVFCLAGNWVASFLLAHNSVYWVLVVAIFCKLSQAPEYRVQYRYVRANKYNAIAQ